MHERYVEKPVEKMPEDMKRLEERPPFDTVTRYAGSLNRNVENRKITEEFLEGRKKVQGIARNLGIIESEALELIEGETVVNMRHDLIDNIRRVF